MAMVSIISIVNCKYEICNWALILLTDIPEFYGLQLVVPSCEVWNGKMVLHFSTFHLLYNFYLANYSVFSQLSLKFDF